jgi:hypothetical protein
MSLAVAMVVHLWMDPIRPRPLVRIEHACVQNNLFSQISLKSNQIPQPPLDSHKQKW